MPRTSARDMVLFALKWINARHAGLMLPRLQQETRYNVYY